MKQMRRARLCIVLALLAAAAPAAGQNASLGPKDGAGLPASDLERVRVGAVAPDFTLLSKDGKRITLSRYRGKKNVVLVFYRGHW